MWFSLWEQAIGYRYAHKQRWSSVWPHLVSFLGRGKKKACKMLIFFTKFPAVRLMIINSGTVQPGMAQKCSEMYNTALIILKVPYAYSKHEHSYQEVFILKNNHWTLWQYVFLSRQCGESQERK